MFDTRRQVWGLSPYVSYAGVAQLIERLLNIKDVFCCFTELQGKEILNGG